MSIVSSNYLSSFPDEGGNYGAFGGVHYPDWMRPELAALAVAYRCGRDRNSETPCMMRACISRGDRLQCIALPIFRRRLVVRQST
jgi:hypothetical protein